MNILSSLAAMLAPAQSLDATEVRQIAQQFATCAVKGEPKIAATYVLDGRVWLDQRHFRRLFSSYCVPSDGRSYAALRARREHMRYAFAEALIRREYADLSHIDVGQAAPLAHEAGLIRPLDPKSKQPTPEEIEAYTKEANANAAISLLGECTVRANPVAAQGLLLTKIGSEAEEHQFATLMPIARNCIEKGAAVRLTKFSLRGTIALNLYRLARAPRIVTGATN